MEQPLIFIGSSSEGKAIAEKVADILRGVATVRVWTDVFDLGDTSIETLFRELDRCDFAVLIATADDQLVSRSTSSHVPRDNIIFEAGLFMGRLGRKRAFVLSDSGLKLPSDLAGVTIARFDRNKKKSVREATAKILEALAKSHATDEVGFLNAYLRFIDPESTHLSDTYADILTQHYDELVTELKYLKRIEDWPRLLKLKERLREYFEYTGRYEEGIAFGKAYCAALRALGRQHEAAWSQLKDVGYMYILCGYYGQGRKAFRKALKIAQKHSSGVSASDRATLSIYVNRYLAISYHRDTAVPSLQKAKDCLEIATQEIAMVENVQLREELKAKVARNRGHIEFDEGNFGDAFQLYRESLDYFEGQEHPNLEHLGIGHLSLAKAVIAYGDGATDDPVTHLQRAEKAFTRIGWIEGQARVAEQRAQLYKRKAERHRDQSEGPTYLREAWAAVQTSQLLFDKIRPKRFEGRVDPILDDLRHLQSTIGD